MTLPEALLAALERNCGRRVRVTIEGRQTLGTLMRGQMGQFSIDGKRLAPLSQITRVELRWQLPNQKPRYSEDWSV